MKVSYQFAIETVEIEVEEVWGEMLMDMDRKEYNNHQSETRRHVSLDDLNLDDTLLPSKDNVEHEILRKEDMKELVDALGLLTPEQLYIVKKIYFEDCSRTAIAVEEGVSEAAIRDRLKRIQEKMKKSLK